MMGVGSREAMTHWTQTPERNEEGRQVRALAQKPLVEWDSWVWSKPKMLEAARDGLQVRIKREQLLWVVRK